MAAAVRSSALASPNDTVRVACVGVRGQGREHLKQYGRMPNVEIAAICDIDETVLNERLGDVEKMGRKRPAAFTDFRKLLEDKSIDAVSIATPNHHHTLQTIWALPGGQGRLRGEALLAQHVRGAADRGRGEEVQPHGAARHQQPVRRGAREAVQQMREGADRRRLHGARPVLQVARHHRPQAGRAGARRACTTTCGWARRRSTPFTREPLPLQLALVLGLRQRRHRQPGHPPDGHRRAGAWA